MDIHEVYDILRRTLAGASRKDIAGQFGISKSTVQHYVDLVKQSGMTLEQAIGLDAPGLQALLGTKQLVRSGFLEPDFENVYLLHHVHGKRRRSLKELWTNYVDKAPKGAATLGYKGFCKAYGRFCKDLPESCQEIELTNQWDFGYVAMIDYSGDDLPLSPRNTDRCASGQIFVGVLPASCYIFCCATPHQTRDDWLDAQVKMLEFFGGVPRHIYLDNSTSLVVKSDRYAPKICREYRDFCDYYTTIALAVRPMKPRDKAMVENAVGLVQKFVLRPLRDRTFFSLEEMNQALLKELDKLNRQPLTTRTDDVSRLDLMQEEKITLRPLPPIPYELSSITKILKVQKKNVVRFENVRYSVPLGYVGRKVKVIKSCKSQTISIFDLATGERIWTHYLSGNKAQDIILREHMPARLRAVMLSKEELVELIGQSGEAGRTLCEKLLEQNHGEVARKVLRGVNNYRTSLGDKLFEQCCAATLKRSVPSYKVLCEEIEAAVAPNRGKTKKANACDRSGLQKGDLRGAEHYGRLIEQSQGK